MTATEVVGRFTRADWDALPDDEWRYELLDGALVVSPAPGLVHQRAVMRVFRLLDDRVPDGMEVLAGPFDVYLPTDDILEPDVLVADRRTLTDTGLEGVPLLAVEVISPSSRRRDVGDKLTAYRDAGVPSYWVVDPVSPRLRVWALKDGEYVEVADVGAEESWKAPAPYPVTVRPVDLVGERRSRP